MNTTRSYTVTTPNGRIYSFAPQNASKAEALARRTGGTLRSPLTRRTTNYADPYGIRAEREVDARRERRNRY